MHFEKKMNTFKNVNNIKIELNLGILNICSVILRLSETTSQDVLKIKYGLKIRNV